MNYENMMEVRGAICLSRGVTSECNKVDSNNNDVLRGIQQLK